MGKRRGLRIESGGALPFRGQGEDTREGDWWEMMSDAEINKRVWHLGNHNILQLANY